MSKKVLNVDEQVNRYSRHVDLSSYAKVDQQKSGKLGYRASATHGKMMGNLKRSMIDIFIREAISKIKDVAPEMIQRQTDYLRDRGMASGTIHGHAKALSDMHVYFHGEQVSLSGLPTRSSDAPTESRAPSHEQVRELIRHQSPEFSLMTEIAQAAGLRGSEISSLRPASEFPAQIPQYRADALIPTRWGDTRNHTAYVVIGKGKLEREVMLPTPLSDRLEAYRLTEPREIHSLRGEEQGRVIEHRYDLPHHEAWSRDVSVKSSELFGDKSHFSGHALRHQFAQKKYSEGGGEQSKEAVSQCLGHFRPQVVEKYLR